MAKKTVYLVVRGRNPGIYSAWDGENGAQKEVQGFSGALYRGFARREDALAWLESLDEETLPPDLRARLSRALGAEMDREAEPAVTGEAGRRVVIYTDGGAIDNPGPGGYGVVLRFGEHRKELSGGYRMTTNNRMELMACIAALEALKRRCSGVLYSDSRYVVDGITKSWAERWRRHHWQRANGEPAENADLWSRLLTLYERHDIAFRWVKGHAGHPGNERADQLASEAARQDDLPPDVAFETGETNPVTPHLL